LKKHNSTSSLSKSGNPFHDVLTGRFTSKKVFSTQHLQKVKVTRISPKTKKQKTTFQFRDLQGQFVSKEIVKEYRQTVKKVSEKVPIKKRIGYSEEGIKRKFYDIPETKVDKKTDIDFSLKVKEIFEKHIKRVKYKNASCYINLYVSVNGQKPVYRSGFINDGHEAQYMTIKVVMSVLRDMGLYIEKSEWRYKKVETHKKKADVVTVYGSLVIQEVSSIIERDKIKESLKLDFSTKTQKGRKRYVRRESELSNID
jgi:hypothetical protein